MTLYRPVVEVHVLGGPTETYYAPFVLMKAKEYEKVTDFICRCEIVYTVNKELKDGESLISMVRYTPLHFNPFKELFT